MAGEYDGSEPIRSLGGDLVPQVWDPTLNGGDGGWRVMVPSDLGGSAPLSAPSSNIPRTLAPTGAAEPLASGACVYGFQLRNDGPGDLYYGTSAVDADRGGLLPAGAETWLPFSDSSAVSVKASAAATYYRGLRL